MLTKIISHEYWQSWFLDDYKSSSGEEAKFQLIEIFIKNMNSPVWKKVFPS